MAKVLLIEPDRILADIYRQALLQAGHKVGVAGNAQMAIDVADDFSPDIVLLELQLVAHSGIEFLYEFRSYPDWQKIPVVIVSNVPPGEFTQSADVLKKQLKVQAYYYKPHTNLKQLVRIVEDEAVRV